MKESDEKYIAENRLTESMLKMSKKIGCSYGKVRNYMIKHDLMLSKEEINAIRKINRENPIAKDSKSINRWEVPFA